MIDVLRYKVSTQEEEIRSFFLSDSSVQVCFPDPPIDYAETGDEAQETLSSTKDAVILPFHISEWSTARSLLKYAGTWVGNDLEQCLEEIKATRADAEF